MSKIQYRKESALFASIPKIPGNFQISQGIGIHHQIVRIIQLGKLRQLGQIRHNRVVEIFQQGSYRNFPSPLSGPIINIKMLNNKIVNLLGWFSNFRKNTMFQP